MNVRPGWQGGLRDRLRPVDRFEPRARKAQVVLLVCVIIFAASTQVRSSTNVWLDTVLYELLFAGAASLCFLRAYLIRDAERWAWLMVGLAITAFATGDLYWTVRFSGMDDPPIVTAADFGYLSFYPLSYAGVIMLIRARATTTPRSVWLDGVVGGLAAASVSAALFFQPIAESSSGGLLLVIINMAYPSADLLMLALVVCSFAMTGWRPDRSWLMFGAALVIMGLSDTIYLFQVATDRYTEATLLDTGWPLATVVIALAAWRKPRRIDGIVFESWTIIVVPLLFALVALAVLTGNKLWNAPSVAVILALGAIIVGFARLALTFREMRLLSESRREARTDELTSLANRRMFYECMDRLLRPRPTPHRVALLLIDLDRFKEINDTLGHQFGDRLLMQIGPRLRQSVHATSVIARLGGDEFGIAIDNASVQSAEAVAMAVQAALDLPFELDGVPVKVTASIGISMFPDHAKDANQLLRHADVAMYSAKEERAQHRLYVPEQDGNSRARLNTIHELRSALTDHRLIVHYQPKVAADGGFAGAEALVRMRGADGNIVPPDEFLPLAEQAGLMRELTARVIDLVLDDIVSWWQQGHRVKVAINLSVTNLLDESFPASVAAALRARGLRGNTLVFEITETTVLSDPERARTAVKRLRSLGAEMSLDDYGTGYASIGYLRQMPLNELKLDRTFVNNLESDEVASAFFTTTVQLAHVLGLRVVAEGIETDRMCELAWAAGCDVGQGYFFGRPLPADDFMTNALSFGLLESTQATEATGRHMRPIR